ncbi:endonuclease/exonuclease/phosphatase family protein [Shewanella sp. GutDb-MelDb]|uniref:endonuclease/exonuclease/phosphatase family protein n=1 Tax=Shewanella sp. GutDb-MelDb TaxID=2058316 RepID=UPI000C79AE13|nr:endonuclease/exonuclease/phosphatase family protein [Shewanella sp. GutDb-MelDb]PKG55961.1 endonuclease [Shewanella sp. GutDb-MelDb]
MILLETNIEQVALTPFKVKVASFNLFNYVEPPLAYYDFENIYTSEQWVKKQRWLHDFLSEQQPDIIGFQEVFSASALAEQVRDAGLSHFAVMDKPSVVDDFICRDPVVAIASKFAFEEVVSIEVDKPYAEGLGLESEFNYSRKPLRVTVVLPDIGHCDIYVVHFKSKRPSVDELPPPKTATEGQATQTNRANRANYGELLGRNVLGQWASSIQRGSEAALLFHSMMQRRVETQNAMMLMGDFNDDLSNQVLSFLTTKELRFEKDGLGELASYPLTDAYQLYCQSVSAAIDKQTPDEEIPLSQRQPTHYYGAQGNVLDYILLSQDFNPAFHTSTAEVSHYHTEDRHLINPQYDRDSHSTDHAPVVCTLCSRR